MNLKRQIEAVESLLAVADTASFGEAAHHAVSLGEQLVEHLREQQRREQAGHPDFNTDRAQVMAFSRWSGHQD